MNCLLFNSINIVLPIAKNITDLFLMVTSFTHLDKDNREVSPFNREGNCSYVLTRTSRTLFWQRMQYQ